MSKNYEIAYTNNITYILLWKSKGLSDLEITSIKTNNYLLNPHIDQYDTSKMKKKKKKKKNNNGSFFDRFPLSITYGKIVNIYIVYKINSNCKDCNYPTIENCLLGFVKLTKNAENDKYGYFGYDVGFDKR